MKSLIPAVAAGCLAAISPLKAQTLVEASTSEEAAAVIRAAGPNTAETIADALGLGIADPVELIFALLSPESASPEINAFAAAVTRAAPRRADEIGASAVLAANIGADEARLLSLIDALLSALAATDLNPEEKEAEALEVLAALLSVADPRLTTVIADAVAGQPGGGAALLAVLGEGPQTAAIPEDPRSFGAPPFALTLTPSAAAQDAPSAN